MLKSELIRPRLTIRGKRVNPRQLKADYQWLGIANDLIQIFTNHVGQSRGILNEALRDYEGDKTAYPIIRGLTAVLHNRCTYNNDPPVPPTELRTHLFGQGPISHQPAPWQPHTRADLIRQTAATYNLTPTAIEDTLFADLVEEQILVEDGGLITPTDLINRYNLEVARGLLYWAREVTIWLGDGYKDIFKYIKLFKLMHTIQIAEEGGYHITLHGPISPFVQSTMRYGLQFAKFMPALLLCNRWRMTAEVRPPRTDGFCQYTLDDSTTLVGHFKGSGPFDSQIEANFAAEFEAKYGRSKRIWELSREDMILDLEDSVMIPDFAFTNKKDGRRALLEIIGFWHPNYLRRKIEKVAKAKQSNLILLVYESANVSAEPFTAVSAGEVLTFKNKPVLKSVLNAVERCAI